jgi:hypothetical protein
MLRNASRRLTQRHDSWIGGALEVGLGEEKGLLIVAAECLDRWGSSAESARQAKECERSLFGFGN